MRPSSRLVRVACLATAGVVLTAGAAPAQPRPALRWGGDAEGGAPFVEADARDPRVVRGFDVEIAEMLARGLGRAPRFVQVQWASIPSSVERGDFDVGLSGIEDRPALRARHALTIPYFEFREVLAVRPADTARYRTLADLARRRVATLGGTLAYDLLVAEQARTGLVPVSYDDDVHPYDDLVSGRVDAVLLDDVLAARSLQRVGGFVVQPAAVATGAYVAVFARRDSVLRDSANAILVARMRDGSLEATFRKWEVWSDAQAQHFARTLESNAGAASRPFASLRVTAESSAAGAEGSAAGAESRALRGLAELPEYAPTLLRAAFLTLLLTLLAMALAVALGLLVAAGRVYGGRVTRALLGAWVEIVRGTPLLLQLFVIYYGLAGVVRLPAFVAAVIGLGLNYAAYESEIYRAALQAIPAAQLEAARTLGLSERQVLGLVRGPQALRLALAPMTNDFVALLKDSSLVSVITVVELTKQTAIYATNVGSWVVPGLACAAAYLALSLPLSRLARRLERRWSVA